MYVSLVCENCDCEFIVTHSEAIGRRYCSKACYRDENRRFWEKVRKTSECWLWTARLTEDGYGTFSFRGKTQLAHRIAYFMAYGDFGGMQVLHHCDNRKCVRPEHLFLGTNDDNVRDKVAKNRQARGQRVPTGERSPQHVLTQRQVDDIRRLYAAGGTTYQQLADRFGVSLAQIGNIVLGHAWRESFNAKRIEKEMERR